MGVEAARQNGFQVTVFDSLGAGEEILSTLNW
jgi:hypothetical protein